MIKPLHPTLKKCACGKILSRSQLYKHFETQKRVCKLLGTSFFATHGEVPLNIDDPALFPSLLPSEEDSRRVLLNNSNPPIC